MASHTKPLSRRIPAPDADATVRVKAAYRHFLKQRVPEKKQQAGEDLIRAIFGPDAIAKDPIH